MAMRSRKLIALVLASIAISVAVFGWRSRCPFELQIVSWEPADFLDAAGTKMGLLELRIENRQDQTIQFDENVLCAAKVADRWKEVPTAWTIKQLWGSSIYTKSSPHVAGMTLVLPADATACRFQLKHRTLGKPPLPLGIGEPAARCEAPSTFVLRVQQLTARISRPLYNWLWPANVPNRTAEPGRWRHSTIEIDLLRRIEDPRTNNGRVKTATAPPSS